MRSTERQDYRTAKAVELLVKARRRTQILVPRRAPEGACPMESRRGGAGCSQGRVPHSQGKIWRVAKIHRGDVRVMFFVAKIVR